MATTSSLRTAGDGGVGGKIVKNRRVHNDDEEEKIGNDISFHEDDRLDKVLSPSSKSDNKRAIEQLVTEETYSRKEANELIKLVRSRIVDSNGTFGETSPNMRTSAIMEARKWLQEKRSGSKKKFEMELDSANVASPFQGGSAVMSGGLLYNMLLRQNVVYISRSENGSPVDMARSYMLNRPAWASPTLKQAEAGSSSPLGMLHFKEETPMSTLRSSEMKKSSFTSGSWNLLEEIRRVRSKATEELLASAPLTKTILFSSESNLPQDSVLNKEVEEGAGPAESTHDKPENETSTLYRVSQEGEAIQSVEHQESQEAAANFYAMLHVLELRQNDNDEVKQLKDTTAENGYGCSASGLDQAQDTANEARPSEGENGKLVDSSQAERDTHMEDNLNPQEEPVIDIPTDAVVNGSQNSSSMQQEELSQNFSQPVAGDSPASKVKDTQKERKSRGYTRRGRGKGK
uniref:Protein KAKU4 n=1 Tax=Chenopodium quinoa TaxID=63459 RepID=A0A803LB12_CHEQI